jgi:hypothetical protein
MKKRALKKFWIFKIWIPKETGTQLSKVQDPSDATQTGSVTQCHQHHPPEDV